MFNRFDKIFNSFILNEESANIFYTPEEVLKTIKNKNYSSFKEFREDKDLLNKLKISGNSLKQKTAEYIWNELEKIDEDNDKEKYDYLNQLFYFIKELC